MPEHMRQAMHRAYAPSMSGEHKHGRTDVTDGLTEKGCHLPEITPSSVTRTRAYGFSSSADFGDTARTAATLLHLMGPDPDAALHLMQLRWWLGDFCAIPRCDGPHKALQLCDAHYRAHQRATRNEAHIINRTAKTKAART